MDEIVNRDSFKVALVTIACMVVIIFVATQVIHVRVELAVMGPILIFLGYLVSDSWTPIPEWNPALFWSLAIVFTALVEIAFAYVTR